MAEFNLNSGSTFSEGGKNMKKKCSSKGKGYSMPKKMVKPKKKK